MQENTGVEIQDSVSEVSSQKPSESEGSMNLLQDVTLNLFSLMNEVTRKKINTDTVNVACNCAKQIHKLLELNYRITKGRR